MIKKIILVGDAGREVIRNWQGVTAKRKRFLRSMERSNGFLGACVYVKTGNKEERVDFDFVFAKTVEEAIRIAEELKTELAKKKIVTVINASEAEEARRRILSGKTAKRYHYTPYGWVVYFEKNIKEGDVQEFAAKFFNENLLWSNKDPDEVDRCLWIAANYPK